MHTIINTRLAKLLRTIAPYRTHTTSLKQIIIYLTIPYRCASASRYVVNTLYKTETKKSQSVDSHININLLQGA